MGRVVNFSSVFAVKVFHGSIAYSVAKASVREMTRHLAAHCAPKNILVNAVCPSHIKGSKRHKAAFKTELGEEFVQRNMPFKRLVDRRELGELVHFLTSDLNQSITGQNITLDGGLSLQNISLGLDRIFKK